MTDGRLAGCAAFTKTSLQQDNPSTDRYRWRTFDGVAAQGDQGQAKLSQSLRIDSSVLVTQPHCLMATNGWCCDIYMSHVAT